jgi:hypothetical protein
VEVDGDRPHDPSEHDAVEAHPRRRVAEDVGSGAPSAPHQCRHRQVDLDTQAAGRWYPGAVQGSLGSSGLHSAPWSRLQ